MGKKKRWFPESMVLIFAIIVVAQLLTYVVPTGVYDRVPAPGESLQSAPMVGAQGGRCRRYG